MLKLIVLTMLVTGYCDASGASPFEGITASGVRATEITIACPPWMEFGTKILMGDNTYICQDRGGAIKGLRLDRWFPTCEAAIQWGRVEKQVITPRTVVRW